MRRDLPDESPTRGGRRDPPDARYPVGAFVLASFDPPRRHRRHLRDEEMHNSFQMLDLHSFNELNGLTKRKEGAFAIERP